MEGRTIVRPEAAVSAGFHARLDPSMEGRTIVRPEGGRNVRASFYVASFNGGPDNCPAGALALFGVVYLRVRGCLRAVLEAEASKGIDSVVKLEKTAPTRLRVLPRTWQRNLALASDDCGA